MSEHADSRFVRGVSHPFLFGIFTMPEAAVIVLDNSDYMRNGDHIPTRMQSQLEALNIISKHKCDSNPENNVALMLSGVPGMEVLATLTQDLGKIFTAIRNITYAPKIDLIAALRKAMLVLKHRPNHASRPRIVAVVGSPISATVQEMNTLGLQMKKSSMNIDIILMAEVDENLPKVQALVQTVGDQSHLIVAHPGGGVLSDIIVSSPVIGEISVPSAGGEGGAPAQESDLDMAMRLSMESYQQDEQRRRGDQPATAPEAAMQTPAPATAVSRTAGGMDVEAYDEDEELRRAIELSLAEGGQPITGVETHPDAMDVEPAPLATPQRPTATNVNQTQSATQLPPGVTPEMLTAALASLPGVDVNSEQIQAMLRDLAKPQEEDKKKK